MMPKRSGIMGRDARLHAFHPRRIVVGLLQRAEVSEGPGHSIPVAFVVADTFVGPTDGGSEDVRYVTCHAGLLGDADDQSSME